MNAHLRKKVEDRAKEFVEVGNNIYGAEKGFVTFEECSSDTQGLLLGIAKHVLCCEIRGRIEELTNIQKFGWFDTEIRTSIDNKIKDLTKQLKEIEEI